MHGLKKNITYKELGERLYNIYREGVYINYPIDRKFIDELRSKQLDKLINGFVLTRAQFEKEEYQNDHVEAFWDMYNELQ